MGKCFHELQRKKNLDEGILIRIKAARGHRGVARRDKRLDGSLVEVMGSYVIEHKRGENLRTQASSQAPANLRG